MRCCDFGTSRLRAAAGAEWLGTPRGNCDHPGQWSMGSTNGGFLRIELHLFYFSPPARWGSLDFISQRIDMTVEVICHVIGGFPNCSIGHEWPDVSTCSLLWPPRCYCTDGTPPTISWYVGSTIDLVGDISTLHWPYKVPLSNSWKHQTAKTL